MQIIAVSTGLNIYMGWARVSFNPREGPTWPASWQCRSCPGRGGRPSQWGGLAWSTCPPLCHCPSRSSVMDRIKIWWTRMTWLDLEVPGYKWKPSWKDTEYTDSYFLTLDMATYPRIQCFKGSRSHHKTLIVPSHRKRERRAHNSLCFEWKWRSAGPPATLADAFQR